MEESGGKGLWREFLVYFQRYQLPEDLSGIRQANAIMFDTHTRNPYYPLHDPERKAGKDLKHISVDSRAKNATRNSYLFDRLLEWRAAYSGNLYIHENLMIHRSHGVPRFNTRVYLEDLRQLQKAGIDGALYETYECGIRPWLPTLDVLAQALWNPTAEYAIHDDVYPELHEFYKLIRANDQRNDWRSVYDLMRYVLDRPDRNQFDWLYLGYDTMKRAHARKPLTNLTPLEREFIETRKFWDFMEGRPQAREVAGQLIQQIVHKLEPAVAKGGKQ
jgi:hypothetical protein